MNQVAEIEHLLNERSTQIHTISHGQNKAGHVMVAIGHGEQHTASWLTHARSPGDYHYDCR